jgi:hypothetical protein
MLCRCAVLCSAHWSLLVQVSEALCALLFPFSWQGVYMPLLPESLCDFLYSPVPFIAGIHSSYLEQIDRPSGVVFVDVDKNETYVPSLDAVPNIPEKESKKLLAQLKKFANLHTHNHQSTVKADLAFLNGNRTDGRDGHTTGRGGTQHSRTHTDSWPLWLTVPLLCSVAPADRDDDPD